MPIYFIAGSTGCYEAKDEEDARQFRNVMGAEWRRCSQTEYMAQFQRARQAKRDQMEIFKIKYPHIDWEGLYGN